MSQSEGSDARISDRVCFLAIVLGLLLVYNLNFRELGVADTIPASLQPESILSEGTFRLDRFRPIFRADKRLRRTAEFTGGLRRKDGHLLSGYPVGGPLLATPVYALPVAMGWLSEWSDYRLAAKLSASLMTALSAGFIFLAMRRFARAGPAALLAIAYGLGTSAWTIASQAMWQHGPGMLCLSVALFCALRLEDDSRRSTAILLGVAVGLAVVCRQFNVIPAAALSLFVVVRHRSQLLPYGAPLAAIGVWLVWLNLSTFGDITGATREMLQSPALRNLDFEAGEMFSHPLFAGLAGLLVSPSKGLIVFSPFLLLAFAGFWPAVRDPSFPLGPYLVLWVVVALVVFAKVIVWWGGASYGPRYLSEALLPLTLILARAWPRLAARRALRALFAGGVALGVGVQVVGAFYTPCGWDKSPRWLHRNTERLWDWRDPETLRCLSVGLREGPRPFEFLASRANAAPGSEPPRWNLLVLVPDTVRADHLGVNGYTRKTSPAIDALAREGVNFGQAVTVAPRTWQSFSSILTGLYPTRHGVRFIFDDPIPRELPLLSSVLGERGFETAAFDVNAFLEEMTEGDDFQRYIVADGRGHAGDLDRSLLAQVAAFARESRSGPFLAFVRLLGGHWPYDRGEPFEPETCAEHSHAFNQGGLGITRAPPGDGVELVDANAFRRLVWTPDADPSARRHRIAHYDGAIRAVDARIGVLLSRLRGWGILEKTIVVVTSDHGESFGRHGYLQHGPRVDESVMRVPLVIRLPRGHPLHRPGLHVDAPVRVVDVFPTILDLLEVPIPPALDGVSLAPLMRGESPRASWAYGESGRSFVGIDPERHFEGVEGKQRMVRTADWKLVRVPTPGGDVYKLFDLSRDPDEARDVSNEFPERVAELREYLDLAQGQERARAGPRVLGPDQRARLRELGYAP